VDPVTAEDGFQYEREDIEKHFEHMDSSGALTLRSPMTNLPMGMKLMDAVVLRNIIQQMVESGAFGQGVVVRYNLHREIAGLKKRARDDDMGAMKLLAELYETGRLGLEACPEQARHWRARMAVHDLERRAICDDDTKAMCTLGRAFGTGALGLRIDERQAFHWFNMASRHLDPHGMACAGNAIAEGKGTGQNNFLGATLVAAAAAMWSDCGCYFLGKYYHFGRCGLRQDPGMAKQYLTFSIQLNESGNGFLDKERIDDAKALLRTIQT